MESTNKSKIAIINDPTRLTKAQVHEVFATLEDTDSKSTDTLEAAIKATESANYEEVTEQPTDVDAATYAALSGVMPTEILSDEDKSKISNNAIKDIVDSYGVRDEDSVAMLNLIIEVKNNPKITNLFDKLPEGFKKIAIGIASSATAPGIPLNQIKNISAKILIDTMMNDASLMDAVDEYNNEIKETMGNINTEVSNLFTEQLEETFSKIDEIRAEDPDVAARIEAVKAAFDDAGTFTRQLDYLDHTSAKKLNKELTRYNSEVVYFNTKVNTTAVKVPNINKLFFVIKRLMPQFLDSEIHKFIIVVIKSTVYKMQIDDKENIANLAYVYRLISNIVACDYMDINNDKAKEVMEGVSAVITRINNL